MLIQRGGQQHLDIDESDLLTDDYTITQETAAAARDAGFDAVLAPAAGLPDRQTLAVFASALPKVHAERSEIRKPPPRLAELEVPRSHGQVGCGVIMPRGRRVC